MEAEVVVVGQLFPLRVINRHGCLKPARNGVGQIGN